MNALRVDFQKNLICIFDDKIAKYSDPLYDPNISILFHLFFRSAKNYFYGSWKNKIARFNVILSKGNIFLAIWDFFFSFEHHLI
jgi:hypothetical protein